MASDLDAYLAALGVPPAAPVAPAAPAPVGAPPAPAGPSTWETVLRAALPALGGFLTARQGTLGSFAGAYSDQEAQFRNQARQDEQLRMQQENQRRLRDAEARQLMEDQAQAEYRRAQAKAILDKAAADEAKAKTADVQKRLDEAAKNPMLNTLINAFGPDAFALKTPNGNMSLRDAQALGAVIPGELGQPKLPEKKEPKAPALITAPDANGNPIRVEDKPGQRVYYQPRAPKEPKAEPRGETRVWKDDDPASDTYGQTFTLRYDADGNLISKTLIPRGTVASTAPAGAPRKIGKYSVTVEN